MHQLLGKVRSYSHHKGVRTHQFAKVVNGVAKEGRYTKIVCTEESFFWGQIPLDIDTGKVKERVSVVWRIFRFGLVYMLSIYRRVFENALHLVIVGSNAIICSIHPAFNIVQCIENLPRLVHIILGPFQITIQKFCVGQRREEEHMSVLRLGGVDPGDEGR